MVQIDNMEMPTNCFDCDLSYDYFRCAITRTNYYEDEQFNPSEERLPDCPLRDAHPVRHGHWIESDTDGFVCSVCRNGYRNQPTLMGKPMFEYCPVCGARMDGEQNDTN